MKYGVRVGKTRDWIKNYLVSSRRGGKGEANLKPRLGFISLWSRAEDKAREMSENSPPLGSQARLPEAGLSNASPYLDDFDDLGNGPSLLGRRVIRPPGFDAGSATHPVSPRAAADEVCDDAKTVKLEQEDEVETEIYAPVVRLPKRRKPRVKPDPPNSTFSSRQSLRDLRARFRIFKEVKFALPTQSERVDAPPDGYFTMYEAYFDLCFIWFPILEVLLEYVWEYRIALAQITPHRLHHLIGLLVLSYECDRELTALHLMNFLEIRKTGNRGKIYYFTAGRPFYQVIKGFPSKDKFWFEKFFFVKINEAFVGSNWLDKILTEWGTRAPKRLLKFPKDTNRHHEAFFARRLNLRDKIALAKKKTAEAARRTEEQQLAEVDTRTEVEPDSSAGAHIESAEPVPDDPIADQSSHPSASVYAAIDRYGSALALRPSTSSLIRHEEPSHRDGSRKHGAASRREPCFDEKAPKQLRRSFSDRGRVATDLDWTAASIFSRITLSGTRFPPFDTLQGEGSYAEMVHHGVQFISHLNKMTLDYEAESRANRLQLEDAQQDVEKYKGDVSLATKRSADLESEVKQLRDQLGRVRKENEDLTASNTRRFCRLEDSFAKLRSLEKQEVNVHKARCEMTTKFWETLTRIERQFNVVEQAREKSFDLDQAKSNLQFIQQVRSETPPDLESNKKDLIAAMAESKGAYQMLTDEVANLWRILHALPVGLDHGEHIKLAAASQGVCNFSGSNNEIPGFSDLGAKKAASGPTTTESSAPAPGALAVVIVEPIVAPTEQVTDVVIPPPRDASEGDGSVPSVHVDAEVAEQVPMEDAEVAE